MTIDSCYLCEREKEGLFIPAPWTPDGQVLIGTRCVMEALFLHPMLAGFAPAEEKDLVHLNH